MKGNAYTLMLSKVQLLRVRVTFHTLPLFYLRSHAEITRQWKPTFRDETASVSLWILRDLCCKRRRIQLENVIIHLNSFGGRLIFGFVCRLMDLLQGSI